jgi:SPP1 family predicted phage head-tail adaptor
MRAGNLRHVIDIEDATGVPDGMGGFTDTYSAKYSGLRAGIWPTNAKERVENLKMGMSISHKIRIRYRSGIRSDMRVKFGTRYFNIISIINRDERNELIDMIADEVA